MGEKRELDIRNQAFQWWNSAIPEETDLRKPPQWVNPSTASKVWAKLIPTFQLFIFDEDNVIKYWETIHSIISLFSPTPVPKPLIRFPDFIVHLYTIQNILAPKTVPDCVTFIERFSPSDIPHFFIYQLPFFLGDPLLYLKTIIHLNNIQSPFIEKIVSIPMNIISFFGTYSDYLNPIPKSSCSESWEHHITLAEVIYILLDRFSITFPSNKSFPSILFKYIDLISKILPTSPRKYLFSFTRFSISCFSILLQQFDSSIFPISQIQSRATSLLSILDNRESPTFRYALRFFLRYSFKGSNTSIISIPHVVRMLTSRPIRSVEDIEILFYLTEHSHFSVALSVVTYLCRSAVNSIIWHRAAMTTVKQILLMEEQSSDKRVKDLKLWMQSFMNHIFMFIALSHHQKKYNRKAFLFCETLIYLTDVNILWLYQTSIKAAASMCASKMMPQYIYHCFSLNSMVDEALLKELETFTQLQYPLKYFPFDGETGPLLNSSLIKSNMSFKMQTKQRPSTAKVSFNSNHPLNDSNFHKTECKSTTNLKPTKISHSKFLIQTKSITSSRTKNIPSLKSNNVLNTKSHIYSSRTASVGKDKSPSFISKSYHSVSNFSKKSKDPNMNFSNEPSIFKNLPETKQKPIIRPYTLNCSLK